MGNQNSITLVMNAIIAQGSDTHSETTAKNIYDTLTTTNDTLRTKVKHADMVQILTKLSRVEPSLIEVTDRGRAGKRFNLTLSKYRSSQEPQKPDKKVKIRKRLPRVEIRPTVDRAEVMRLKLMTEAIAKLKQSASEMASLRELFRESELMIPGIEGVPKSKIEHTYSDAINPEFGCVRYYAHLTQIGDGEPFVWLSRKQYKTVRNGHKFFHKCSAVCENRGLEGYWRDIGFEFVSRSVVVFGVNHTNKFNILAGSRGKRSYRRFVRAHPTHISDEPPF